MPNGMTLHDPQIFTSWKEIAAYLGKGVRTVQRWEAQFGLPVQRPNSRSKGIVRASRGELDQWIATRWSARSMRVEIPLDLGSSTQSSEPDAALVTSGIHLMRRLRTENRQLLNDLERSMTVLRGTCNELLINLRTGRELRTEIRQPGGEERPRDKSKN